MNEDDVLDYGLEEVEPESLPLDQVDESVEGFEGYPEEEGDGDDSVDPLGGNDDLVGPEDPTE